MDRLLRIQLGIYPQICPVSCFCGPGVRPLSCQLVPGMKSAVAAVGARLGPVSRAHITDDCDFINRTTESDFQTALPDIRCVRALARVPDAPKCSRHF